MIPLADALDLDDYESEINLRAHSWVQALGEVVAEGVVLLIDYGYPRAEYYHPQRDQGTLMCYYRHHTHPDPLDSAGTAGHYHPCGFYRRGRGGTAGRFLSGGIYHPGPLFDG